MLAHVVPLIKTADMHGAAQCVCVCAVETWDADKESFAETKAGSGRGHCYTVGICCHICMVYGADDLVLIPSLLCLQNANSRRLGLIYLLYDCFFFCAFNKQTALLYRCELKYQFVLIP